MAEPRKCIVCGEDFISKAYNARYCSRECYRSKNLKNMEKYRERKKKEREKERQLIEMKSKKLTLSQVESLARQAGMHYGLYVALNKL